MKQGRIFHNKGELDSVEIVSAVILLKEFKAYFYDIATLYVLLFFARSNFCVRTVFAISYPVSISAM